MALLHELEIKAVDVLNPYVMETIKEKIQTLFGPEFGDDTGKSAILAIVLHGLKSAGIYFSAHLAQCMQELGCESFEADPDL